MDLVLLKIFQFSWIFMALSLQKCQNISYIILSAYEWILTFMPFEKVFHFKLGHKLIKSQNFLYFSYPPTTGCPNKSTPVACCNSELAGALILGHPVSLRIIYDSLKKQAEKLKSCEIKEGWMKNDESWWMNDEGW